MDGYDKLVGALKFLGLCRDTSDLNEIISDVNEIASRYRSLEMIVELVGNRANELQLTKMTKLMNRTGEYSSWKPL